MRLVVAYDPARANLLHISYEGRAGGDDAFELVEPYTRETSHGTFTAPAGFCTDLASTPWQVWRRYPKFGRWTGAAVIHDLIYRTPGHFGLRREQADEVLAELMARDGVPLGRRRWMTWVVREFGDRSWNALHSTAAR